MRVVFMGTPAYAVPVLEALANSPGAEVVAVYTPPDRPGGRGRNPLEPPVKTYAGEAGLEILQPPTLRSQEARQVLAGFQPEVIVVAAYGRLLPPEVLDLPPHGCLNLHPSLLPRYRGPSPVVTAILEGEEVTGVSLMLLDQGMDTGPVIASREVPLSGDEKAGELTECLFRLGADLLLESLSPWADGKLRAEPQDAEKSTVTRKVEREHGNADWTKPAVRLERSCRAYTPWPSLFTQWEGKNLKLLDTRVLDSTEIPGMMANGTPGLVVYTSHPDAPLGVLTGDGVLGIEALQLEGRKAVAAAEFLRGFPNILGARL